MVVFEKTKGLTDNQLHYCPGCTHGIIHRLVAEVLEDFQNALEELLKDVDFVQESVIDIQINVNQINLYAGYSSDVLELRTVQSVIPINFNLLLNLLKSHLMKILVGNRHPQQSKFELHQNNKVEPKYIAVFRNTYRPK